MTRHLFINSSIDGTPSIDLKAGTVSGMTIATDKYQRLGAGTGPNANNQGNLPVGLGDVPTDGSCCDRIVGGRIILHQNGNTFELTGDVNISPALFERESTPTNSGRMMTVIRPKLATAEIEFANFCDGDPLAMFDLGCKVSITIEELDR
jgi:hypothetical protein